MTASAQLNGNGYYRVKSAKQGRYINVIDNRGSISVATTSADMNALRTVLGFERVVSSPSSIIYVKKLSSNGYDLQSQGTGSYAIISHEIKILDKGDGSYWAYATASGMATQYLMDEEISWMWGTNDERRIIGNLDTTGKPDNKADWHIMPVTTADNNYFGLTPNVAVDGSYYQSFYASFPFAFASEGMSAYAVTTVDPERSAVVISELTGGVPAATPVIIKCSSVEPVNNKLNVGAAASSAVSSNLLKGVYFCNDVTDSRHRNVVENTATIRVLGKANDGSLAFVKATELAYIPANTAYITVPADAPEVLKVCTPGEYGDLVTGLDTPLSDEHAGDVYDLNGRKVRSASTTLEDLPKGVYIIGGRKVVK